MYEGLFQQSTKQEPRKVFANFPWRKDKGEDWEAPFQRLAVYTSEQWGFQRPELRKPGKRLPILTSYLNYTFLRLQQQDKIGYSSDQTRACINTGLQSLEGKDLFATFYKTPHAEQRNAPDWTLYTYCDGFSDKLRGFDPLPDIATYIDDASDLVFDHRLGVEVDHKHILTTNKSRLPDVLQSDAALARNSLNGGIDEMRARLRRNYKLAVPHWYNGRIQLLLPLTLTDDRTSDRALVAEKDLERKKYLIRTILTLDMAYLDARVICAPDRQWLNP